MTNNLKTILVILAIAVVSCKKRGSGNSTPVNTSINCGNLKVDFYLPKGFYLRKVDTEYIRTPNSERYRYKSVNNKNWDLLIEVSYTRTLQFIGDEDSALKAAVFCDTTLTSGDVYYSFIDTINHVNYLHIRERWYGRCYARDELTGTVNTNIIWVDYRNNDFPNDTISFNRTRDSIFSSLTVANRRR